MSLWRQMSRGLRALTRQSAVDRDLDDEVHDYLNRAAAEHEARGLSPEAARRAARVDLGGVTSVIEQVRSSGWENLMSTFIADVRYAVRGLRGAPGFAAVVIFTLALGIGGTTAIFSAVNPILFHPVPYPDGDRVVMVIETNASGYRADGTFNMYRWLADRSRSLQSLAVFKSWQPAATDGNPERLEGQRVSAGYFQVLGVAPALGSDFNAADDVPNGPNVAILSDGLWRRRFAADRSIVGHAITLNGASFTVVGVMPAGFTNVLAPAAEIWAPMQYGESQGRAWGHHLRTVGRLKPGVALKPAAQEIDQLGHAAVTELRPDTYGRDVVVFTTVPLGDELVRSVKPTLLAVLGGVSLVLVIACVNVTNLLLARGVRRRSEFALRVALGAGQVRLVRQLLAESLVLATLGGVAGLVLASAGVPVLVALGPPGLPGASAIRVDSAVFLFAFAVSVVVGVFVGLIPAFQARRANPQQDLLHASTRTTGGHRRTRSSLVVAEVALAIMLLVASGLLLRSLQHLFAIPPGFDTSSTLTVQLQTVRQFDTPDAPAVLFDQVSQRVRAVPGVTAVAFTSQLPLSGDRDEYGVHFDMGTDQCCPAFRYAVSPTYLDQLRVPLIQGRRFDDHDAAGAPRVVLLSQSLAAAKFGTESPIGHHLSIGPRDGPPFSVVGVVGDLKQLSLAGGDASAVYMTASQSPFGEQVVSLVIRADRRPTDLEPVIRQAVLSVDKTLIVRRVATMDELIAATAAERRFILVLFGAFALAALVLAAAGIYGVLAGSVAERTREIGVRSVLGATRASIVGLVVRQGLTLTGIGVGIGIIGAAIASRGLITLLFRTSHLDPITYIGGVLLLSCIAMLACAVPSWRAARVDPATTLRAE